MKQSRSQDQEQRVTQHSGQNQNQTRCCLNMQRPHVPCCCPYTAASSASCRWWSEACCSLSPPTPESSVCRSLERREERGDRRGEERREERGDRRGDRRGERREERRQERREETGEETGEESTVSFLLLQISDISLLVPVALYSHYSGRKTSMFNLNSWNIGSIILVNVINWGSQQE